jgi:hypothetical protein
MKLLPSLRRRHPRRGVSLLTILVSLALVAAVAMVAIPAYFGSAEVTLDAAVRLLDRDVRALQNRAAVSRSAGRLVFDADGWQALALDGNTLTSVADNAPIVRRFSRDGVFEGVTIEAIDCEGDAQLEVNERGLTAETGRLTLRFGDGWRLVEIESGAGHLVVTQPADDDQ